MPKLKDLQGDHIFAVSVPGQATAGTADEFAGFVAPFDLTVTAVKFIPKAAITGVATNFFTATARNRGAAGAGSTQIASRAYSNGNNATALAPDALTLSGTAANLNVAEGEHVSFEKLVSGTGLAMPAGTFQVHAKRR